MNWESYSTAVVRINFAGGDVEIHPAPLTHTVGTFPNVEGRTIHIITAHNPGGRDASPAANEKAHRRLQAQVTDAGLTWWPAAGGNPTWTHVEASVAVIGLDDDAARALGAAYGQEAIFAWRPNAWLVLSCTDAGAGLTGWALRPTAVTQTAVPTTAPNPHLLPRAISVAPDQPSSTTVQQPRTASVARLQHAPGAAPTVPVFPDSWLGEGGYLDRLARRRGRLVSVRGERDVTLELHGLGDGLVLVRGPVAYTNGPHDLLTTLIALGAQDLFDPDGEFMSGLLSGEWDQGEVASVFARWYDLSEYGGVEFIVDDILVSTDGHGQSNVNPHDVSDHVLARIDWEVPGGGGSPGNADDGSVMLVRWGDRYIVYAVGGGECVPEDFAAADDDDAVARFHAQESVPPEDTESPD